MQAKIKWHSETRKITNLKEWDRNPRLLTEKGIKDLTSSINKFGLAEPIVINTDGLIIGGHARFKVLQANGEKEVECYVPNKKLSDEQVEELNIRLNANVAGSWDFECLANSWDNEKLAEWGVDLQPFYNPENKEKEIDNSLDLANECPSCGYKW